MTERYIGRERLNVERLGRLLKQSRHIIRITNFAAYLL